MSKSELTYEQAQFNKERVEMAVLGKYRYNIQYAYESWYTYDRDFDLNKTLVKGPAKFTNTSAWVRAYNECSKSSEHVVRDGDQFCSKCGAEVVIKKANNDWSAEFTDATIIDILKIFEESIVGTGDYHHCFLEGISVKEIEGVKVVNFVTGS